MLTVSAIIGLTKLYDIMIPDKEWEKRRETQLESIKDEIKKLNNSADEVKDLMNRKPQNKYLLLK